MTSKSEHHPDFEQLLFQVAVRHRQIT